MFRRVTMIALTASLFAAEIENTPAQELTEKRFEQLHKELQPASDEPWRTIPWRISLLDGQRTAAKERKPLFIWAMDGHPLGCT